MVEIKEVTRFFNKLDQIMRFTIDGPLAGARFPSFELPMSGWVTATKPVSVIEARGQGSIWRFLPVTRSDVSERFPDIPPARRPAFQGNVSSLRLPHHFDVALVVVFDDGDEVTVGRIQGTRESLQPGFHPRLNPLLLNCLGRSGSTWTTHVLSQHPEIVAYQTFRLEPRVAGYWLDVLGALAEPASYTQSLQPEVIGEDWWLGRDRRQVISMHQIDEEMGRWLGGDAIRSLAAFCMGRIEKFYDVAAHGQGKYDPSVFLERTYGIGSFAPRMMRELYPGSHEIFLVRDFRDVFCSMKSFKGGSLPRRHLATDDVDYVRNQLREYIAGLYRGWLDRKRKAYLLRYEELVRHPQETLTDLLGYVGVANDADTVGKVLEQAYRTCPERQAAHKTISDPLSSIERWRNELEPEVQQAFSEAMGEIFEEFGYPATSKLVGAGPL